jgi:uncharacterized membrane protein YfcA
MSDPFFTYLSLSIAAFSAGIVNALAGGGTLLTFPALVAAVGTERLANVTSTVALVPGSLASAWGFRHELGENARWLRLLIPPSLLGGLVGALLLTRLPARYFALVVPWLLLAASLLFLVQPYVARVVLSKEEAPPGAALQALVVFFQFLVAVYGGYFGAGIGILMLSSLGLMGMGDVHRMNAVKTILATCINGISVVVFAFSEVAWTFALVMSLAAIVGGYAGARVGRRLPRVLVRWFVILVGLGLSFHYFREQYLAR